MGKNIHGRRLDIIFVLIIFCVFASSVLVVLTLSGNIYKNMTQSISDGYNEKTCLSYIWSKVKSVDGSGRIYVEDFHGAPALCLEEDYGGSRYVTRLYLYDNWVREMFGAAELDFYPEDGLPIVKAASLTFRPADGGLIKAESDTGELYIYPNVQTGLAFQKTD